VAAVRCLEPGGSNGMMSLRTPQGWRVDPPAVALDFAADGEARTVRFDVTVPAGTPAATYDVAYKVDCTGRAAGFDLDPVRLPAEGALGPADDVNCGWEAFHIRPAAVRLELVEVEFPKTVRCAYVGGVADRILPALARFDVDLTELSDEDLEF